VKINWEITLPSLAHRSREQQEAFADLFERHKNLVYRTALLILGEPAEAEEALQEIFVLVYKSLASYDPGKGAFTTWLHRITVNYCLSVRRKRRVAQQPLDGDCSALVGETMEASLAERSEKEGLRRVLGELSDKQRAVLVLRYYWEMPYAEISQVLKIPLGTVKSRLDLALRTLRGRLLGEAENHPEEEVAK